MSASKKEKEPIHDVDMGDYGISENRLATSGLNSCIGFIAFLNNGEDIFIKHLTDLNLPTNMNLDNVRECLEVNSGDIDDALPYGNITGIIILGGHGNKERFQNFQQCINQLIDNHIQYNTIKDADLNNKTNVQSTMEKINHYQQLFTNVICNDTYFNLGPESDTITKITDKHMGNGERLAVGVQRVTKIDTSNVTSNKLIGVLAVGIKTNNRWFAIDRSSKKRHKGILK